MDERLLRDGVMTQTILLSFELVSWVSLRRGRFAAQASGWLCMAVAAIPRCARGQRCVLSCAPRAGCSFSQGATTLRCRRFALATTLGRPLAAFKFLGLFDRGRAVAWKIGWYGWRA